MKWDTVEKSKRILPSFVMHLADGITDIHVLRRRVEVHRFQLGRAVVETFAQTHSGHYQTAEIEKMDRQLAQLSGFLELTDPNNTPAPPRKHR